MRYLPYLLIALLCGSANAHILPCGHARFDAALFREGLPPNAMLLENPGDTDVLNYNLDIEAKPATSEILGTVVITAQSKVDGLTQFHFRLRDNYTISSIKLDTRTISFVRESQTTCRAVFDQAYNLDQTFQLSITYSGVAVSRGFGSIEFGTRSNGQPYVFTLSEPFYCYTWWPAKEENFDKATAQIAVTVPSTMVVASNGLLQGVDPVSGSRSKYRWATNYPIAPYLICFGATNFNTWTQTYSFTGGSMPVQFYIWPEDDTAGNRASWEKCLNMLATYKNLYGIYPFTNEKYGIYEFIFGGGMEHQTLTGQGTFSESVTAHELGHQWWGDMVTCRTWSDIWLNEGFATYTEALWEENKTGVASLPALKAAMAARRPSSVNGSVYRTNVTDINSIFSTDYSYRKGGWVLHQLRHVVGDATFFNILAQYRAQYQYSSAISDEFAAVAESVYGQDLDWFFQKWIYGIGAPAYSWGWQSVTVNGNRYLLVNIAQTQTASYGTYAMPIDIRPTVGGVKQSLKVFDNAVSQWFVLPLTGTATACTFDEDVWTLNTGVTALAYVPGPPKIVQVSPQLGTTASWGLTQIKVYFHTPVNSVGANFTVVGAKTGTRTFNYSYDAANNCAVLTFPAGLVKDTYTVTVSDLLTAANSGKKLDGEITSPANPSSLPSGNGIEAGNAVFTVKVGLGIPTLFDDGG